MNIFSELDYREIIRKSVRKRREVDRKFNFLRLSEQSKVQNTYLSKAMRGHADLSADQLYSICDCLKFSPAERDYLLLLLDHARSTNPKRRQELGKRIETVRSRHLRSEEHLTARAVSISTEGIQEYYLDPLNQIVHICLSIERFKQAPSLLAQVLRIPETRLSSALHTLERIGVIARLKSGVRILVDHIHLPRDSALFPSWRSQLRAQSLQRVQDASPDQAYSFSVVFSADPATRARMHALFLEYLQSVEALVKSAPVEQAYQMNFDLHAWTMD